MMFPTQPPRGSGPRGVCWAWRKGFCARGRGCIYRHEEKPSTRTDNRICRWEYATRCHSRGSCGLKHLQLSTSEAGKKLEYFRSFGRNGKDLTQRDLGELLRVAIGLFVDGDQDLRFLVISTLSSGWHLEQLKLCLHPSFLFQPYPPQISWHEHVVPLLRIMSDPVNTIHEPSMESLRSLYEVVLDPRHRPFWRRVMKFIQDSLKLYPFRVASQITGVITILLLSIGFDGRNLKNPIVQESVPLLVKYLKELREIYTHGYLSPVLSEAVDALQQTVSGKVSALDALTTVASKSLPKHQMAGLRALASIEPKPVVQTAAVTDKQRESSEPLEQRLLSFATNNLMTSYLTGLSGHTVNGGLIAGTGFADDEVENQVLTDTDDLEDELEKIPYSLSHQGEIGTEADTIGIFSVGPQKNAVQSMVFTNDAGDALFQRWKERAADPTSLNFDWGKNTNGTSMKDFLQLTLTLFVAASTETRLQFISGCLLKDEYLGKLWECLEVRLPTDSINHPSPKYSDHVSTVIHMMSHPDVVNRHEFQVVRKALSEMFVSVPNYLYGILEYMKLHARSKKKNAEMIEACVRSIILILEGVFKLVDPRNIPMEFRHEAKQFLKFAIAVEGTTPWASRTDALTTETVQSFIRSDEKLFPESTPPHICSSRQKDRAREQADIASGAKQGNPTTQEINNSFSNRIRSGNVVVPVSSYLDENGEYVSPAQRERGSRRAREEDERGWDDGKPIVHRVELETHHEPAAVEEAKQEFEEEAQPMNDQEALEFLRKPNPSMVPDSLVSLPGKNTAAVNGAAEYPTSELKVEVELTGSSNLKARGPFNSYVGSVTDDRMSVSVKTCPRFPRHGRGTMTDNSVRCDKSDSSGSPPKGGSVLNYLSKYHTTLPGQAALERISATLEMAQRSMLKLSGQRSNHGSVVGDLEALVLTNGLQFGYGTAGKRSGETAPGHKTPIELVTGAELAKPWPSFNGSTQLELLEEGEVPAEPLAEPQLGGVRLGPRPRDRATTQYYRAIYGTAYPKFNFDVSGDAGGFERGQSAKDTNLNREAHPGDAEKWDKVRKPNIHSNNLCLPTDQTYPTEGQVSVGQKGRDPAFPLEEYRLAPSEDRKKGNLQDWPRLHEDSRLTSKQTGDFQGRLAKYPIAGEATAPDTRGAMAPLVGSPANQGGNPDGGRKFEMGNFPTAHDAAFSVRRPLATSNKDHIVWPNPCLEAVEAERGRPVGRLTSRHDQNFVPRRVSQVRNPNEVRELLPCGHTRGLNRDENYCNERVNKKTPYCGHEANVECSNMMKQWKCKLVCGAHLPCSHYCKRDCFQCLEEIKIDDNPIWNHGPCQICLKIRAAKEARRELEGQQRESNTANVADRAQAPEYV
ncbi:hypothetical protein TWF481_003091 [Arthrobotrys musiformis]|uniref:C3H1-type domain-containing protein n=1 Tax=Arthrobotrys musiformis TaxID=47236 RepID=A0AAV9VRE3_9PEZI